MDDVPSNAKPGAYRTVVRYAGRFSVAMRRPSPRPPADGPPLAKIRRSATPRALLELPLMTSTISPGRPSTSRRRQNVSTFDISKDDLYRWADEVLKPQQRLHLPETATFSAENGAWLLQGKKRVLRQSRSQSGQLAQYRFQLLPDGHRNRSHSFYKVDELISWASDIGNMPLQQALSGKEWNGLEAGRRRSNRKYSNEAAVIQTVEAPQDFDPAKEAARRHCHAEASLGKSCLR